MAKIGGTGKAVGNETITTAAVYLCNVLTYALKL